MKKEDFLASKVKLTKSIIDSIYGEYIIHSDTAYCYCDGLFIEILGDKHYYLLLDRSEYTYTSLEEAEEKLY